MNRSFNNIKDRFSGYVLKSVKNNRKNFLDKKYKIEGLEFSDSEELYLGLEEAGDIIYHLEKAKERAYKGIAELKGLIDQVEDYKLFQILLSLPEKKKRIILLRIFYEQSFREIAEHLKIPEKKVSDTYYNIIKKIRKQLGDHRHGI